MKNFNGDLAAREASASRRAQKKRGDVTAL
jgi:hypothetical protein